MGKHREWLPLAVLIGIFFGASEVALSGVEQPKPPAIRTLKVSDLFVPRELGQLSNVQQAPGPDSSAKLVILVQDAHVNYEAQRNLAAILDRLVSDHGVSLILVEGGEGDVGLSYLRARGSQEAVKEVAERYLESGMISGEEYLDMVSDHALTLWGIDDDALYDDAMASLVEMDGGRETLERQLGALATTIDAIRATTANEPLRALEAQRALFDKEQLPVDQYLHYLLSTGAPMGVLLTSAQPNLQRLVDTGELERVLDYAQVEVEQRQAVGELRQRVSADELAPLKAAGAQLKAGKAEAVVFYRLFDSLMRRAQLDLATFPHLRDYIRYVTLKADLDSAALLHELSSLHTQLKDTLMTSSDEAELSAMAEGISRFQRLLSLQWTPEDYQGYLAHRGEWRLSQWVPRVQAHAARAGVAWAWDGDAVALDERLARAVRFYHAASARDEEMVHRALAKMDDAHQQAAVLIVGGFHADHLRQLLARQGVSVAVITPLVGSGGDEHRYATVLKAKYADRKPPAPIDKQAPSIKHQIPNKHQ